MTENSIGINDILQILEILVRRRRIVVYTLLIIIIPVSLSVLVMPAKYIATVTVLPPELGNNPIIGNLSGAMADMTGFNLPGGNNLSILYEPILKSRRIITNILKGKFKSESLEDNLPLIDILKIEGGSKAEQFDIGYSLFINEILNVDTEKISKITAIIVETGEPQLSADIANMLVKELDNFSRELKINQAKENKIFIEERLIENLDSLNIAEEDLKSFRQLNRRIEKSPQLLLEQNRLKRELRVQEEIYMLLRKEFEFVKIEEVKNLPLIQILDEAVAPIKKSNPKRRKIMVITTLVAFSLGIGIAFIKERFEIIYRNVEHNSLFLKVISPIKKDYESLGKIIGRVFKKVDSLDT